MGIVSKNTKASTTMTELFIDLETLGQRPLTVHFDYDASDLQADDEAFTWIGRVRGDVTFARVA